MKLSKQKIKAHEYAMALVGLERDLTYEERVFVLTNYNEAAEHMNSKAGAFFTPTGLARDFALHVTGRRVIDLCAGIGALAFACVEDGRELICIEVNSDYARVGRKVVPEALWIVCSAFDVQVADLGQFDTAISNPPFGAIKGDGFTGKYTGSKFEYKIMELASRIAHHGVFIVPQESAVYRYSGKAGLYREEGKEAKKFREQTGLEMLTEPSIGVDTAIYLEDWNGVSPMCEIVEIEYQPQLIERIPQAQFDF